MMKRYLKYICMLLVVLSGITSCSDVEFFDSEDEVVSMTYTIGLDDDVSSRAIGDGSQVDKLYVGIYEGNMEVERLEANINDGKADITVELFKGRTYDLAFWAQSSQTSVYDRTDLKNVDITYPESMTLQEADRMDAFFLLKEDVTVNQMGEDGGALTLTRPFAQLNIASSEADAPEKVKKAILTVNYENSDPLILTFTDFTVGEGDKISYDGLDYYYLVTALLKPGIITANITLLDGNNNEIESFDLNEGNGMELVANYRYNVLGDMITPEELPGWDGVFPTESPLTQDEQNRYIIDEEMDLAWLSQNASSLIENSTFIVTKEVLDMGNHSISSIQLPIGSTFDGGGKTIKNFANSLFGDVTNLTVQNLVLDNVNATSNGHVGVLVNTLIGSSSLTGVTIRNSSATTTDGAAGGMIGYITSKEGETLEVTFSGCTAIDNEVNGSLTSGVYVGRFRGYTNSETLTFSFCNESSNEIKGVYPYYVEGNEATWLAENDYSNYSGWLGNEEYYRGTVRFGYVDENDKGILFIPKWDGTTIVEPIVENNVKLIYSPYDVAKLQNNSHAAVTFEANVDLGSHEFEPIKSITNLDGKGHTIYNLKVDMVHDIEYGAAFIKYTSGNTTHKDLNFVGAYIHNDHDKTIPIPEYGNENDGGAGNAYAGTLIATVGGTYNVSNIHVMKGCVSAVCKMGGLIGRVGGVMTMENCSVKEYTLENYEANIPNYYNVPPYDIANLGTVHGLQWWYTQGECGGLIGFIQSTETIIRGCSVTDSNINCYGQPDKSVVANVWLTATFNKNPLYTSGKDLLGKANTDIAGRHVNQFIGDVVSQRSEGGTNYVVTIEDYEVSGNKYWGNDANSTNDYNHNYENGKYCEVVGCAYYVGVDVDALGIKRHIMYCAGELIFNKKGDTKTTITEAVGSGNSIAWKGGSFTELQTTVLFWSPKSEYPAPPPA